MAAHPENFTQGSVQATIYSDDEPVVGDAEFVSISINKGLNRIPKARIVFDDDEMTNKDFPVSNRDQFKPGAPIKITAGDGKKQNVLFEGIVVRHSIKVSQSNFLLSGSCSC